MAAANLLVARGLDAAAAARPLSGVRVGAVALGTGPGLARDADGRLEAFLDERRWSAMTLRPNSYVYGGTATDREIEALVGALADLARSGVGPPAPRHGQAA